MDRFGERESVSAADRRSPPGDVNFSDVFGGPPRRSSMYETRQRYSGDSDAVDGEEEEEEEEEEESLPYRAQWPGMREKAVFGEDTSNHRRRRRANDFYNDIFRSDESLSSSPASRVLSPVPDPSAPSPFSLSPKLPKVMDLPTFGSPPRGSRSSKDLDSEGINFSSSPRVTLSRFSSESAQDQERKNDIYSLYRQSSLSRQVSHNSDELSNAVVSERTDGANSKTATNSSEVLGDGPQFHFSIYKWASKGVPLMMPPRGRNSSRSKEMGKSEMTSSFKGPMPNENVEGKSTTATPSSLKGSLPNEDLEEKSTTATPSSLKGSLPKDNLEGKSTTTTTTPRDIDKPFFAMDSNKKDNGLLLSTRNQSREESSRMVEEEIISLPKPATVSRVQRTVEDYSWDTIFNNTREKTGPNSHSEVGLGGKPNKETPTAEQGTHKANDLKPLRSHLSDSIEQDNHAKSVAGRNKGNKKAVAEKNQAGKNMKKQEEKQNSLIDTEVVADVDDSPKKPEKGLGRNRVRGKMKEFVKIFNQEVSSKTKTVVDPRSQSQSCRWNGTFRPEKEASRHVAEKNQKLQPHPNKEVTLEDATIMELKNVTPSEVDEYLKQSEERYSATQTENYTISSNTSEPEYTSVSSTAPVPDVPQTVVADTDESFHQDFVMEELPLEENGKPQPDKDREVKQIIDAKIRKWSNGKEGNIRSLLSTLQYVLWPECGWKPVPLVNIIEGNAVKRSYQRALLYLHPDKLQQKGASLDQKYTAEKVFDILQEAWDQFNALGSL